MQLSILCLQLLFSLSNLFQNKKKKKILITFDMYDSTVALLPRPSILPIAKTAIDVTEYFCRKPFISINQKVMILTSS